MRGLRRALAPTALAVAALVALGTAGCGAVPVAVAGPAHDMPVPASERRAELRFRVDLIPAQGCEEAFDLALYKHLGVDLVQWDERAGECTGRVVTLRYLPRRLAEAELLAAVRALAAKAERLPPAKGPSP